MPTATEIAMAGQREPGIQSWYPRTPGSAPRSRGTGRPPGVHRPIRVMKLRGWGTSVSTAAAPSSETTISRARIHIPSQVAGAELGVGRPEVEELGAPEVVGAAGQPPQAQQPDEARHPGAAPAEQREVLGPGGGRSRRTAGSPIARLRSKSSWLVSPPSRLTAIETGTITEWTRAVGSPAARSRWREVPHRPARVEEPLRSSGPGRAPPASGSSATRTRSTGRTSVVTSAHRWRLL